MLPEVGGADLGLRCEVEHCARALGSAIAHCVEVPGVGGQVLQLHVVLVGAGVVPLKSCNPVQFPSLALLASAWENAWLVIRPKYDRLS